MILHCRPGDLPHMHQVGLFHFFCQFFYSIALAKKEMEKRSHTIKESNFAFDIFNWNKILQLQALVFSRALVDQGVLFKQQVPVTFWPDWSKYSYFKYRALPLLLFMLLFRFLVLTESWSQSWSNVFSSTLDLVISYRKFQVHCPLSLHDDPQIYLEESDDVAAVTHMYKSMENHLDERFGPVEDFFRDDYFLALISQGQG